MNAPLWYMSHILVNTLYYYKRKKKLMNFTLCPRAACSRCSCFLIVRITLSLSCHAIPLHQDSKICDTKQSITEKKIRLTKIKLTCFNFCYSLPYFNTFHCILKNRLRLTADVFQTDAKSLVDSVVELEFPALA